jgi:hypothetical protein
MRKLFCDNCGVEIDASNRFSDFGVSVKDVVFKVAITDAIPIDYCACKYCVLDAIRQKDDRPSCAN